MRVVSLNKCELLTSSERKHAKIRLLVVFRSIVKIIQEYGGVLELTKWLIDSFARHYTMAKLACAPFHAVYDDVHALPHGSKY